MERIKIITDSSADLSTDVIQQWEIEVVPVMVTFGSETFPETSITREEFWERFQGPDHPSTSQPPLGLFRQAFSQWVEAGYRVLCTTLTGRHSGTYDTACAAAAEFDGRVTVVDSLSLSLAQAAQVLEAAQLAAQGASMEHILQAMQSVRDRSHVVIQLDTLEHLRRGGRAARLMPVLDRMTRMLNIKPLLTLRDGELKFMSVVRSYRKGIDRIREEMLRLGRLQHLAVVHTRRPELADWLAAELADYTQVPRDQISVCETGAVLSSHAGAGLIAAAGVRAR